MRGNKKVVKKSTRKTKPAQQSSEGPSTSSAAPQASQGPSTSSAAPVAPAPPLSRREANRLKKLKADAVKHCRKAAVYKSPYLIKSYAIYDPDNKDAPYPQVINRLPSNGASLYNDFRRKYPNRRVEQEHFDQLFRDLWTEHMIQKRAGMIVYGDPGWMEFMRRTIANIPESRD